MRVCLPHCKAFVLLRSGITFNHLTSARGAKSDRGHARSRARSRLPPLELVRRGVAVHSAPLRPAGSRAVGFPGRERAAGGVGAVSTQGPNSRPSLHRLHVSCSIPAIHSCPRNFTFPPLSLQHSIPVEIATGSFQKSPPRCLVLLKRHSALCPRVS